MREVKTTGMICIDDFFGFTYNVGKIEYFEREDESFKYVITPNYSVISLLPVSLFQGIPGIDLDLGREFYVRENRVPVFISERTPGENREDLWELLEACGMDYLNRLEWLIRTDTRYSGDPLYAERYEDKSADEVISLEEISESECRSVRMIRHLLKFLCLGRDIAVGDSLICDDNRKAYYTLLMSLYKKEKSYLRESQREGVRKAEQLGKGPGRKRIPVDELKMHEVLEDYRKKRMNAGEACQKLGISRATFFRRLKGNEW